MKKLFLTIAIIAPMIVSCGGNSKNGNAADSEASSSCCEEQIEVKVPDPDDIKEGDGYLDISVFIPSRVHDLKSIKPVTLKQLQGSWQYASDPFYCQMDISGDTVLFTDSEPECIYKLTLSNGNTFMTKGLECMDDDSGFGHETETKVWFVGDTLLLGDAQMACEYLPFETVCIGGKRVSFNFEGKSDKEARLAEIIDRLSAEPYRVTIYNEWNALSDCVTEGANYETMKKCLAKLYDEHPMHFLSWFSCYFDMNRIEEIIFGNKSASKKGVIPEERLRKDMARFPIDGEMDHFRELLK